MAKQLGPFFITGTMDNICFYRLDAVYYVRSKSSLDGKRVKTDPAFANTMKYAGLLKEASMLASSLYRSLRSDQRQHGLYRRLTGIAMRLLKEGTGIEEVKEQLYQYIAVVRVSRTSIKNESFVAWRHAPRQPHICGHTPGGGTPAQANMRLPTYMKYTFSFHKIVNKVLLEVIL